MNRNGPQEEGGDSLSFLPVRGFPRRGIFFSGRTRNYNAKSAYASVHRYPLRTRWIGRRASAGDAFVLGGNERGTFHPPPPGWNQSEMCKL